MKYDQLLKKHGVNRVSQLQSPPLQLVTKIQLPENSVIHFVPESDAQYGPRPDDPMLTGLYENANLAIDHITRYVGEVGNPKALPDTSSRNISKYQRSYRLIRPLRRLETTLRNRNVVVLVNYGMLNGQYRFTRSIFSDMWRWQSIVNTFKDALNKYGRLSTRPQFLKLGLPSVLSSYDELKRASNNISRKLLPELTNNDLWLLSLFNWLDDEVSSDSQYLSNIPTETLSLLNFYWMVDDKVTILPFSVLIDLKASKKAAGQRDLVGLVETLIDNRAQGSSGDESDEPSTIPVEDVTEPTLDSEIKRQAELMAEKGQISAAEYRRMLKLSERHSTLDNPFGDGKLVDMIKVSTETANTLSDPELVDMDTVLDKSMTRSSLKNFDSDYVEKVMQADIASMVLSTQNAGIAVTNYKVDKVVDAAGASYSYTIQLTPLVGKPSTLHFQLPVVEEDGTFLAGGVKSRLDKQRADMPIRKISPSRVALTSYFGKLFIDRDERSVYNYSRWVTNAIIKLTASDDDMRPKVSLSDVFDPSVTVPRVYASIARRISKLTYGGYTLIFDYSARNTIVPDSELRKYETKGMVVCGKKGKSIVTVDDNDVFYLVDDKTKVIGDINTLMDDKLGIGPIEIITAKIFGSNIALGLILAYRHGLTRLLKMLSVKYRRVPKGTRVSVDSSEYRLTFEDETLIFDRDDRKSSLVIGGFNQFKNAIKSHSIGEFDKPDIYLNVLESQGFALRHLREIDLMYQMFIDPITLDILKEIKEPTTFNGLLMRSVELLMTDQHPRETDMEYMRVRGYERLSGLVYSELIKSIRGYNAKPKNASSQVEMNPRAVWMGVSTDTSLMLVEELNPVNNLKEKERLSYSGLGGRDAQTMVKRTREFHPNDQGVISEATLDSGKAGATTYLTADPNFTNLRGVTRRLNKDDGTAKQVSTTFLLLPCTDREDPKRTNFVNVQYTHTIAIEGNDIQPLRTGYEEVISHRVDPMYAIEAKDDGVIADVSNNALNVKYAKLGDKTYSIGKYFGKVSAIYAPHEIICDRQPNYKFKKGEILAFNTGFFKRDYFNPTQVCFLSGFMAKIALMESVDTLEDSCAISKRASEMLKTKISINRDIVVEYDQSIHNLVRVGDSVEIDSPLCTIEDEVTSAGGLFEGDALSTLTALSANTPRAGETGIIDDIEVIYYGDIEDMSENLRTLAKQYDKIRAKRVKEQKLDRALTGELTEAILIGKRPIVRNNLVVRLKITKDVGMGVGDKGVVANQLKTVACRVMHGVNETESGIPIDGIFGFQSISNRIVLSAEIAGTVNTTLRLISEKASEIYES